jgi:hypothetical protein
MLELARNRLLSCRSEWAIWEESHAKQTCCVMRRCNTGPELAGCGERGRRRWWQRRLVTRGMHGHGHFDHGQFRNRFLRNQFLFGGGWGWGGWGSWPYDNSGGSNTTVVFFPQAKPQMATGSVDPAPCNWKQQDFTVPSSRGGTRPVQVVSCR